MIVCCEDSESPVPGYAATASECVPEAAAADWLIVKDALFCGLLITDAAVLST